MKSWQGAEMDRTNFMKSNLKSVKVKLVCRPRSDVWCRLNWMTTRMVFMEYTFDDVIDDIDDEDFKLNNADKIKDAIRGTLLDNGGQGMVDNFHGGIK